MNPLIFIGIITLIAFSTSILIGMIFRKSLILRLSGLEMRIARISAVLIVVGNWIFIILIQPR